MRDFHYLLLADSAVHAVRGNIPDALQSHLAARRMAHHIDNDVLICFQVSFGINKNSDEALARLLAACPMNEKTLADLKNELLREPYHPKSFKTTLMKEKEMCLLEISRMTPERFENVLYEESKEYVEQLLTVLKKDDLAFLERSAEYLRNYNDKVFAGMEKPYAQGYAEIGAALDQAEKDAKKGKAEAVFPAILFPVIPKFYNNSIIWKTSYDATLTALDVYIAAAKDGKLPEELPPSTYIDHFSGKPFLYEVTPDGFTLKCRQEDLEKKITHEFHYTLPK